MKATGEKNGRAKLTWAKVDQIREKHRHGLSTLAIAVIYDLAQSTVWNIVANRSWVRREAEPWSTAGFKYQP